MRLQQFITAGKYNTEVKSFYTLVNYETACIQSKDFASLSIFFNVLQHCDSMGLSENDYQPAIINALRNNTARLQTTEDSLDAELRITDAAINFFSDISYGNENPPLGYNGLNYKPGCYDIPALIDDYISEIYCSY